MQEGQLGAELKGNVERSNVGHLVVAHVEEGEKVAHLDFVLSVALQHHQYVLHQLQAEGQPAASQSRPHLTFTDVRLARRINVAQMIVQLIHAVPQSSLQLQLGGSSHSIPIAAGRHCLLSREKATHGHNLMVEQAILGQIGQESRAQRFEANGGIVAEVAIRFAAQHKLLVIRTHCLAYLLHDFSNVRYGELKIKCM